MIAISIEFWQPAVALRKRGRILTVNAVHEAGNREDFQKLVIEGDRMSISISGAANVQDYFATEQ